jgi:hypothetical protein
MLPEPLARDMRHQWEYRWRLAVTRGKCN